MRALLFAATALIASPALAQDHSAHAGHEPSDEVAGQDLPSETGADHSARDHGQDHGGVDPGQMDHKTMDHGQMDHGGMDHAQMDHGQMDHSQMDHSQMDHGAMDGGQMDHGAMDHTGMDHGADHAPAAGPPPRALEGPAHAADEIYGSAAMAPARQAMVRENGGSSTGTFMFDRLEAKVGEGEDFYLWDAQGWYGGDFDKLWIKSEGEGAFGGTVESAEVQALWSHAIGPWFDLQAGARYDIEPAGRAHAVLGVQGLAPYMFEIDAAAFLSDRGDLTARLEAEYDQRITQRLILQPRAEISLAAQDIPSIGVGSGLSSIEAGLRLRYEFAREFAPYVGVGYEAKLGRTADYARAAGEDPSRVSLLLGIRAWF